MSGWQTIPLGEVADFIRGVTFKPTDVVEAGTNGTVSCLRTKNVQLDLDLSDVWSIDRSHVKRDEQYLHEGDLLISSANSWNLVGKCSWVPELESPSTFGGFVTALRPNREKVDPRYLYRFFSSARIQATVRSFARQTTNISNLDLRRCAALPLPLPPIGEQRRIAAILDQADALRARRREALTGLDELTQSIFVDMFGDPVANPKGWRSLTLKAAGIAISSGFSVVAAGGEEHPENRVIKVSAVSGGFFDASESKPLPSNYEPPATHQIREGDLLMTRASGSVDLICITAMVDHAPRHLYLPDKVWRVSVGDAAHVNEAYLTQLFKHQAFRAYVRNAASGASGVRNISQAKVLGFGAATPPIEIQDRFASATSRITRTMADHRVALAELDALFASLQSRAFRGEL
ncbi:restriction endonuclease subunit S [Rhodococcus sp. Q]|uniref:restriction endonuclease subunit S n=1 Tax=Rhodococcus sp. Q TaxID=2502252 RepID=UPI0010F6AFCC|nr:restriction endonuclease subunit S [Rhodococcus sp. Q]